MTALQRHARDAAAFVWGFAEATLFFIVPDVLLSHIGLKLGAAAAVRASAIAALGASVGGAVMYLWAQQNFAAAIDTVAAVPAVSDAMIARAETAMTENWFVATLFGPLSSTPYKLYAVLAPAAGAGLPTFALASVVARLPRFLLVGCGAARIARVLRRRLSERQLIWLLAGAWIAFYAAFFALTPN